MVIVLKKNKIIKFLIAAVIIAVLLFSVRPVIEAIFPLKYEEAIINYSKEYSLDPYLVMGIISAESRFEENAVSHKDAKGLMQLKEETAQWCVEKFKINTSHEKIYEPETNIMIGCCYLSYLTELFGGKIPTAIAAYNAGQGNVAEWLKNPEYSDDGQTLKSIPFPETDTYVKKVLNREKIYKKIYGAVTK
ncbi:MAG: lytic transglycosylase domain-containing protein [Clostridia bacterium]|nr:lytic transglycosylase domain-containing protein [Clostridia bacterium]